MKVLSYGRERRVILEATLHDKDCVLANILAAHFLCSSANPSRASFHIQAANSRLVSALPSVLMYGLCLLMGCFTCEISFNKQEEATPYEKAVFDALNSLICENRDDDVALQFHSKVRLPPPLSLKLIC